MLPVASLILAQTARVNLLVAIHQLDREVGGEQSVKNRIHQNLKMKYPHHGTLQFASRNAGYIGGKGLAAVCHLNCVGDSRAPALDNALQQIAAVLLHQVVQLDDGGFVNRG